MVSESLRQRKSEVELRRVGLGLLNVSLPLTAAQLKEVERVRDEFDKDGAVVLLAKVAKVPVGQVKSGVLSHREECQVWVAGERLLAAAYTEEVLGHALKQVSKHWVWPVHEYYPHYLGGDW